MPPQKKPRMARKCKCGQAMTADDAEFWGECRECRGLPMAPKVVGKDTEAEKADRAYHGGRGHAGEW